MSHPRIEALLRQLEIELDSAKRNLSFWQAQPTIEIFRPDGTLYATQESRVADLLRDVRDLEDAIAVLRDA
jgi:hypothetical protein